MTMGKKVTILFFCVYPSVLPVRVNASPSSDSVHKYRLIPSLIFSGSFNKKKNNLVIFSNILLPVSFPHSPSADWSGKQAIR